jgi:hypothetical protein
MGMRVSDQKGSKLSGGDTNLTTDRAEDKDNKDNLTLSTTSTMKDAAPNYNASQAKAPAQQGSAAGERFRSLRSYIDKSKANMAGRIGQGLQQREQAAVGEIKQAEGTVNRQIKKVEDAQAGATDFGFQGPTPAAPVAAPASTETPPTPVKPETPVSAAIQAKDTFTPEEIEKFQGLITSKAPEFTIPGVSNIGNTVAELGKSAAGLGTEQGRFEELRRNLGAGRGYSAGAQQLDQLLLQTQKGEASKLKELQKTVGKDSREQLQGLAANVDNQTQKLGQAGIDIKKALTEGLKAAQEDVVERSKKAMEAFKGSDDYKKLIAGGYSEEEILQYLQNTLTPGYENKMKGGGRIGNKAITSGEASGDLLSNFYGLTPEQVSNLMTDAKNQATNVGSYSGILSEKDRNVLKNLGLLGGSVIPIDSAEDLGYADDTSIDKIRQSALDSVMKGVTERKDEYKKVEDTYNTEVNNLVTAQQILEKRVDDIYKLMKLAFPPRDRPYTQENVDAYNAYNAATAAMARDYGAGYDSSWFGKLWNNPQYFKDLHKNTAISPALKKLEDKFKTDTAQFRRPK